MNDGFLDSPTATTDYEQEYFGKPEDYANVELEYGTIGYDGDPQVFDELGSSSNDGNTFVKVTLFKGYPVGEPASASGAANGMKILAQLSWPIWAIPLAGTRCIVAFPGGQQATPGAGVIISYPGKSPTTQFSATTAKLDFTGYDLVIKARSISLRDDDNNMLALAPEGGARLCDKTGSGVFVSTGTIICQAQDSTGKVLTAMTLTQDTAGLLCAASSPQAGLKLKDGDCTVTCGNCNLSAFGAIALGAKASPGTCVAVGPLGAPGIATVCSQSVYAQP